MTEWNKTLPASRMIYPASFIDRTKYVFWRLYTPFHPLVREVSLKVGIVSMSRKIERWGARQQYLLGTIAPGESIESVVEHLVQKGFYNHFVAWEDEGEVASLRYLPDFKYQYHIRIFKDGEIRAHYEYTPECHPIYHYYERGCFEDRREEFLKILGGKLAPLT
ncbi:hypothetical protein H7X87_04370 [Acetobacteraceae bacterium]|nr:hypothetical protein [Candidatus Parcubacteria bacterium]